MDGLTVAWIGVRIPYGNGRGVVEAVGGVPARDGDASHAGCIVEISDGAHGSRNG